MQNYEKNSNFLAENCQKSPKIVIITSTPGLFVYFGENEKDQWRCGLVVSSSPATEETGDMGCEIESRQDIAFKRKEIKKKVSIFK
jgi:hypothetical protein